HGHRRHLTVPRMEDAEGRQLDDRHAIRVGGIKRAATQPVGDTMDAPAGLRVDAGVDALDIHAAGPGAIGGELLDQLALVTSEQQEVLKARLRVELDDVPDDRLAADLDQRLGAADRPLLQARSTSPAANDDGFSA